MNVTLCINIDISSEYTGHKLERVNLSAIISTPPNYFYYK